MFLIKFFLILMISLPLTANIILVEGGFLVERISKVSRNYKLLKFSRAKKINGKVWVRNSSAPGTKAPTWVLIETGEIITQENTGLKIDSKGRVKTYDCYQKKGNITVFKGGFEFINTPYVHVLMKKADPVKPNVCSESLTEDAIENGAFSYIYNKKHARKIALLKIGSDFSKRIAELMFGQTSRLYAGMAGDRIGHRTLIIPAHNIVWDNKGETVYLAVGIMYQLRSHWEGGIKHVTLMPILDRSGAAFKAARLFHWAKISKKGGVDFNVFINTW